jgi:CheY-like chemotaxis protein
MHSKELHDTNDLSHLRYELASSISGDDLANSSSHSNISSTHSTVSSGSTQSERMIAGNAETSALEDELASGVKQVLVIDDDHDSALSVKTCLESYYGDDNEEWKFHVFEVTMYVDPVKALAEFKPYYDLLLVDINMPTVNGYELVEKLTRLDFNIKVCFMSSGELNYEALRDIHHPSKSFGCFIKKPATRDYLVNRVVQELF